MYKLKEIERQEDINMVELLRSVVHYKGMSAENTACQLLQHYCSSSVLLPSNYTVLGSVLLLSNYTVLGSVLLLSNYTTIGSVLLLYFY